MKRSAIQFLIDPVSRDPLTLEGSHQDEHEEIKTGTLRGGSGRRYDIRNFIPRFVAEEDDAALHWGEQWNRYLRTQIDKFNGTTLSRRRLFQGTGWKESELQGQRVLEIGCGAGRFTQVLLDAGAEVYAIDYSMSVDACWANNGPHPRLFVAQADLYALPFPHGYFDKVLCYGVLQYTPDPKRAFLGLPLFLKSGGRISVDVYHRTWWTTRWTAKYWYRPLTKRLPRSLLRRIVEWYVPRWIPWDNRFQRLPILRRVIPALVPCWNYSGMLPLSPEQIEEWAILDTFSSLAPRYDNPQSLHTVTEWFTEARLSQIEVQLGGNGILGNGERG